MGLLHNWGGDSASCSAPLQAVTVPLSLGSGPGHDSGLIMPLVRFGMQGSGILGQLKCWGGAGSILPKEGQAQLVRRDRGRRGP